MKFIPERFIRLAQLTLPIVASMLTINLMNLIDTAMVGQLGTAALGGVGLAGQMLVLLTAALLGIGTATQATVARRVGQGLLTEVGALLNSALPLVMLLSVPLVVLAYGTIGGLFPMLSNDVALTEQGLSYFMARLPGVFFVAANVVFRSYWVGVSRSRIVMISIFVTAFANIVFNYLLIFGHFGFPRLGVIGAGIGTSLAVFCGFLVHIGSALRYARPCGFLCEKPEPMSMRWLINLALPESTRQLLFASGVIVFYLLVGLMGTQELASFHVCLTILLVCFIPAQGIGQAATTLVSEAMGKSCLKQAKRWGWEVALVGVSFLGLLTLIILFNSRGILGLFLVDAHTLALAILPLQLGIIGFWINSFPCILNFALLGAGAVTTTLRIEFSRQWLFFLPLVALAVYWNLGLQGVFVALLLDALLGVLVLSLVWQQQRWQAIRI